MAKKRGSSRGFWIAGAMLALFALVLSSGPASAEVPLSERQKPAPVPPPTTFPSPRVFSPNDAAVYVEVVIGNRDIIVSPLAQVGVIARAAAADPLSVQSLLLEELHPTPFSDETVRVFTADAHGNVLGSWSYSGAAAR